MDLQAKLDGFRAQLRKEEALLRDPQNAELTCHKNDIIEAILAELVEQHEQKPSTDPASGGAAVTRTGRVSRGFSFAVGARAEAKYTDGVYYPVTVREVLEDGKLKIEYLGFGVGDIVQSNQLRQIRRATPDRMLAPSQIIEGMWVEGLYAADGKWYSA